MKETDRLLSNGEATTIIDEDAGGEEGNQKCTEEW